MASGTVRCAQFRAYPCCVRGDTVIGLFGGNHVDLIRPRQLDAEGAQPLHGVVVVARDPFHGVEGGVDGALGLCGGDQARGGRGGELVYVLHVDGFAGDGDQVDVEVAGGPYAAVDVDVGDVEVEVLPLVDAVPEVEDIGPQAELG